MEKELWYYKVGEQTTGPISHQELQEKLNRGEVGSSTEIWTEAFKDWLPISEVDRFNMATIDESPLAPVEHVEACLKEIDQGDIKARPWVRFWARMFDYSLFIFIIGFFIGVFHLKLGVLNGFSGITAILFWVFFETFLLATWGTTPGKWMLKVTVRDENHDKLSFSKSMNRSLSVWWLGVGAGMPLICLITMSVAAFKLRKSGVTSWDSRGNIQVFHEDIGLLRTFIVTLYFLCYFSLIVWGQIQR